MNLERLWTPWRAEYVAGDTSADPNAGCFLCDGPRVGNDAASLILKRGSHAYLMLNKYPYSTGHMMAVPFNHGGDLASLATEIGDELWALAQAAVRALTDEYRPEGFNIGMNVGTPGGAGAPNHLHVHVVPRWAGDTNFMPVIAGAKVLPETLEQTYTRMLPRMGAAGAL
jgi:ATP adenylyltransferase